MNETASSESALGRGARLKALRGLARALTGEGSEAKSVWRRMLLGRLASLLLDDEAKLTGAELRSMLETLGTESDSAQAGQAGDRLPEAFENIVHEIYGVNLQRDVKPAADAAEVGK